MFKIDDHAPETGEIFFGLALGAADTGRLIRHLEGGGVRILLYGGNANLYNIAVSEYPALLDFLATNAGEDTLIIPSVGPFYGNIVDQAAILREREFPAAMLLPTTFPATPSGVATAVHGSREEVIEPSAEGAAWRLEAGSAAERQNDEARACKEEGTYLTN